MDVELNMDLIDQVEREACKSTLFEFVQSFWSVIIQEKPKYNWHIPYLCEELQKIAYRIVNRLPKEYDLIINIPPGTTKSTIVTIMYPAWLWTQDPSLRIITNSYSETLSLEHSIKSRDIIQSPKYKRLFPEVQLRRDKGAKSFYGNTQTGSRFATSTGGTVTGEHAHCIINDDPLNPSQAASESQRETANEHTKTLSTRKVDKENTPIITIMQRLHDKDVTGYLLGKKGDKIKHICLPAEISDKISPSELKDRYVDGLLDPIRLSNSILAEQRIDLGSRGYACQYEQTPTAKEGDIIKRAWFQTIHPTDFEKIKRTEPVVFFGDTAYKEKKDRNKDDAQQKNDPSGFMATVTIGNNLYITNVVRAFRKFPDLIKFIPEWVKANGYTDRSTIRIEPKASGISVIDQLKDVTKLNITETPSPKDSKETRLNAVSPKVECGRVWLVAGAWNEDFIEEVCGFPAKMHDEYVDLLCYAIDYHLKEKKEPIDEQNLLSSFS